MKVTRTPIAWLMFGVLIVAVQCAILSSVLLDRPLLGFEYCLDMGLLPTATVLGIALIGMILNPNTRRPFVLGFVASGCLAVLGYILCCRAMPDVVAVPVLYYINEVEPRFMEADTLGSYSLSLIIRGLILSSPQLLIALTGGLLARIAFTRRDTPPPASVLPH
jgi:hypothetical protein